MERGLDILVVHGFAVREGRGKWACCYEIRLAIVSGEPLLLYRGELHGRRYPTEAAAIVAACEIGEREATRHVERARAMIVAWSHPASPHPGLPHPQAVDRAASPDGLSPSDIPPRYDTPAR
jgi:hypothetical protein|uniref:hypothetical protein n=1 Tax=unclassified Cupriavidus TaxID=2640874 RepID=UPI001CC3314E|nr:hypothetical protein [Cupriavidus pauculus]